MMFDWIIRLEFLKTENNTLFTATFWVAGSAAVAGLLAQLLTHPEILAPVIAAVATACVQLFKLWKREKKTRVTETDQIKKMLDEFLQRRVSELEETNRVRLAQIEGLELRLVQALKKQPVRRKRKKPVPKPKP